MFMLESDGRTDEGFAAYDEFVKTNAHRFPSGALTLASSAWYYGFSDHRAPHDSRLLTALFSESPGDGEAEWHNSTVSLQVTLRGAYDDGTIVLSYPRVYAYQLSGLDVSSGHMDWRYDELRIDEAGRLVHEIEWCGFSETGRWLIVADDIRMAWHPDQGEPQEIGEA